FKKEIISIKHFIKKRRFFVNFINRNINYLDEMSYLCLFYSDIDWLGFSAWCFAFIKLISLILDFV
ncbi:hypothetical protein, partial [Enterobacter cloacae complex sp. P42C]|uniref:hypothetical protein n=1 Tax=Enterobacter cloacae complex sp. P42C TaxID=2779546 RepID=UPI001D0364EF